MSVKVCILVKGHGSNESHPPERICVFVARQRLRTAHATVQHR